MARCFSFLTTFIVLLAIFSSIPLSSSTPFIVLHGISMFCQDSGTVYYTQTLKSLLRVQGSCVEVGNGLRDSWMMPMESQVKDACGKIKGMAHLQGGYHMVALSQGNMVGRGVIETCDGPPVKSFISVGGPNAGHSSTFPCGKFPWCGTIGQYYEKGVYTPDTQDHLAPSGYIKIPNDMKGYLSGCRFLPKINNEVQDDQSAIRKKRFTSLTLLVLILFQADTIIMPQISSHFGYYPDGDFSAPVPVQKTQVYIKDTFGFRTLDEAGKVKFFKVPGAHLVITVDEIKRYIVPYMK
ncbi:PREDICTED: palmitoyl-protein thioesterase 1-like [Ipomoea nil]|uniref:palmitoyl-protein thioesterase 1-like n=1 Tax=Ipomoea nil TaxID=35883 RepID=UPI000901EBED|nr:PREDICTED: palmitoyl-protein thioesterase 1-like [Ipomoea nil]